MAPLARLDFRAPLERPVHEQLRPVIADPRVVALAQDIVVEFGNPLYQRLIDRYATPRSGTDRLGASRLAEYDAAASIRERDTISEVAMRPAAAGKLRPEGRLRRGPVIHITGLGARPYGAVRYASCHE